MPPVPDNSINYTHTQYHCNTIVVVGARQHNHILSINNYYSGT